MTTSTMTDKQIERAVEIFRAKLRKRAGELPSDAVQLAFGQPELGDEWFEVLRRRVEVLTSIIELPVDYDAYRSIQPERYAFVGDVTINDYPETETGTKLVRYRELEFDHEPTDQEVLDKAEAENCRQPTRAEAETYIRLSPEELRKNPRIGLTGPAVRRFGGLHRACVDGRGDGVRLCWLWVGFRWFQRCRFVVVCK